MSPEAQSLYENVEFGRQTDKLVKEYALDEEKTAIFIHIFGDAILGFYTVEDIPENLKTKLGFDDTAVATILSELSRYVETIKNLSSGDSPEEPSPQIIPEESSKPLSREEVLAALAPKRTMQSDSQKLGE